MSDPRAESKYVESEAAVLRSQRLASQLHQLVATSIATSSTSDEMAIIAAVAARARTLLGADEAMVRVASDNQTKGALARGGAPTRALVPADEAGEFPRVAEVGEAATVVRDWLCVPILETWNTPLGLIGVRSEGTRPSRDDEEILSLLAQMTASALAETRLRNGLRTSETRWRTLVNSAPVGIVELQRDGTVDWWNRAAASALGWPHAQDDSGATPITWDPQLLEPLQELWNRASGDVARAELTLDRQGRRHELRTTIAALGGDDEDRLLMLVDDVTDEREMRDELRQARGGEIRAQLASSVAHDFNNLLTLITGYTEMLSQSVNDHEALGLIGDIQATTRRASQITQQLQTIGRTQARAATVIDPRRLIESNAEVIERIVGPDIEVRHHLGASDGNILVDGDQFEQVLLNLVINARDAMNGTGTLDLDVTRESDWVTITVSDTGSGMDADTLARCFEPYFTTKGPFKGTGMGLASARRLIEASGGSIEVTSEVGVGTRFSIRLPAVHSPADVDVLESADVAPDSATVLVVEDDDALRRLIVQVLRRAGYRVLEAENGEIALGVAHGEVLDALVSDVDMPVLGGVALALSLQAASPNLPVLLISGHANAAVLGELTPRTSYFLAKPFRPSELVDRVNEILVRARAR
ncbi:MAG: response regulator [Acidobacteriota bacterium]|nr:response regulator [Acidobacteriota bacterium]